MVPLPPLLRGKRIAVLGSGSGLGRALAAAATEAGAEVLGIDPDTRFDHLAELYRYDPTNPGAMDAVARALPEGLDGVALFPALPPGAEACLEQALAAPKRLAEALAPKLAPGAGIVTRAAQPHADWAKSLGLIRAAAALRPGEAAGFATRWALAAEAIDIPRLTGWAMLAWTLSHRATWPNIRVNALTPGGALPPDAPAPAAVFLLSGLSASLTGANLAADGGLSAQIQTSLDGL